MELGEEAMIAFEGNKSYVASSDKDESIISHEGEEEEDDVEEEEEEEVEPKLKFERIPNDMIGILNKDAASCMAVHPKFLALGTHWGAVHLLDHLGNKIDDKEMEIRAHTTTVNQLSIDESGDYIASCSDDGRVIISGLYSKEYNQIMEMNRPVKSVALEPGFGKQGSSRLFVTGDHEKITLNERGFFSRHKQVEIHRGEGAVRSIKWRSHYIAWANDKGVKVYDISLRKKISFIDKEHKLRAELYRCNLYWKDDETLLIGWADRVKICVVRERDALPALPGIGGVGGSSAVASSPPPRYIEITAMFSIDSYVCGLASMGANMVMITYSKDSEPGSAVKPELQILAPYQEYYDELYSGCLSLRGYEEYRCNDYHVECVDEDSLYFIVSPKDVIVGKPRTEDDHIQWLLDHEKYDKALDAATRNEKELRLHTVLGVGKRYIDHLFVNREYESAARLCVKILGKNKELWEEQVYKFAKLKQLKVVSQYLPRGPELILDPAIYEMVMNEYLHSDYTGFYELVKEWPSHLYNVAAIVNVVKECLGTNRSHRGKTLTAEEQRLLLQSLGELFTRQKEYDKALEIYLKLKHKDAFSLIHKHNLFDRIGDKIVLLMEFNKSLAVKLLLDNIDKVSVDTVVDQLRTRRELLHNYLDQLWRVEPHNTQGRKYHGFMVELYAQYDRDKLLSFLRSSSDIPLQTALECCQQRDLIPETVFLLGRMGDVKKALSLIIYGLKDIDQAIAFCKEHDEEDLWADLISQSLNRPAFIRVLLHNIGTHVDPIKLIRKINNDLEIPGLRDSLVKILHDYNLQISLREGCKKILVADSFNLFSKQVSTQKRGVRVEDQLCPECHTPVIVNNIRFAASIAVFYCNHIFHEECLHSMMNAQDKCPLCTVTKKVGSPSKGK